MLHRIFASGALAIIVASASQTTARAARTDELILKARVEPMVDSKYQLAKECDALAQVFRRGAAEPVHSWPNEAFAALIPSAEVKPGELFTIDAERLMPFLRQLHPGATPRLHHGSQEGAFGVVLGRTASLVDILIRLHGEFVVQDRVWITPAQFEGRLVFDTQQHRPRSFSLALPKRNTNVDVNAFMPEHNAILADIGFVPCMEVAGGDANAVDQVTWGDRWSIDEARAQLKARFYAFAEIPWLPIDEALKVAAEEHRPLHIVILFGTLDDESC